MPKRDARRRAETIAAECVGARVRLLSRTMTRVYDEALRPLGLQFSQMNILTVVALHGPIQPSEVTRLLSIEKSTLSRNIRILEERGWIDCRPGQAGNTKDLRITSAGAALLERAAPAWRRAQDEVKSLLGERTAAALVVAADRLLEATG